MKLIITFNHICADCDLLQTYKRHLPGPNLHVQTLEQYHKQGCVQLLATYAGIIKRVYYNILYHEILGCFGL